MGAVVKCVGRRSQKKTFRAALERFQQEDRTLLVKLPDTTSQDLQPKSAYQTNKSPDLQATVLDVPFPEGSVEIGSSLYIERPSIESRCYTTILKPGSLIRIKAPRQMGKTSLLARILHHARRHGYETVALDLQLVDSKIFEDVDRFLQWFCARVTYALRLPNRLTTYWDETFGSKTSCKDYFENYLLPQLNQPLLLALDEVDEVFRHHKITEHFFALLRSWHEEAKNSDLWQKLRLVLVHSTDVYIPLNIHRSPFNVGLAIELPEFNPKHVEELALRHNLSWNLLQVNQLMTMVGGHPYLVRVALYHIARGDLSLEQFLRLAPTETSPYRDHLRRQFWYLQQHPELASALKTVMTATEPVRLNPLTVFQLQSLGLIRLQDHQIALRCELYRQYLGEHLGRS